MSDYSDDDMDFGMIRNQESDEEESESESDSDGEMDDGAKKGKAKKAKKAKGKKKVEVVEEEEEEEEEEEKEEEEEVPAKKKSTKKGKKNSVKKSKKKSAAALAALKARGKKSKGFFKLGTPHTYGTMKEGYFGNAKKSVSGKIYEKYDPKKKYTDKYMEGKIIIMRNERGTFVDYKRSRDAKARFEAQMEDEDFKDKWEANMSAQGELGNLLDKKGNQFSNLKKIKQRGYFSSKGKHLRRLVKMKRKSGGSYAQKSKEHCEKNHEKAKKKKLNVLGHHCNVPKSKTPVKKKKKSKSKSKSSKTKAKKSRK